MSTNLFSRAKAYRKKHPKLSQTEAVKKLAAEDRAKKKKPAARPRAVGKPKKAVIRKVAVKKPKGKKKARVVISLGISGVSMDKIHQELRHQQALHKDLKRHQELLKTKGQAPADKTRIRKDISHYKNAIAASRKHITSLKRSI